MTQSAGHLRYGVFLRPDPTTCWVEAQFHLVLRQQFGFVSALAFPPHVTLVGNLAISGSVADLEDVLAPVLERTAPFTVHNSGVQASGFGYVANVHEDGAGGPNTALVQLAADVKAAVLPLNVPVNDHLVTPVAENGFWGHLSIGSHDLAVQPQLFNEVGEFLAGLPLRFPRTFTAGTVSLLELTADWDGEWWRDMPFRVVRSWTLQN